MAELKIIGVKRVEALLNVLNAKEKEVITALVIPSLPEIKSMVDAEFDVKDKQSKVEALIAEANEILTEFNLVTGGGWKVTQTNDYKRARESDGVLYQERRRELERELRDQPIADVKAAFEAKRTQLWMCETLEEAKAIVGIV